MALEAGPYPYTDLADISDCAQKHGERPFVLLLDSLQDPQNFGSLLRTAEVTGVHGVVIPLARSVEVTPTVVNASAGASEHLLIAQSNLAQAIDRLEEQDVWIVGFDQAGQLLRDSETEKHFGRRAGPGGRRGGRGSARPDAQALRYSAAAAHARPRTSLNAAVAGSVALLSRSCAGDVCDLAGPESTINQTQSILPRPPIHRQS